MNTRKHGTRIFDVYAAIQADPIASELFENIRKWWKPIFMSYWVESKRYAKLAEDPDSQVLMDWLIDRFGVPGSSTPYQDPQVALMDRLDDLLFCAENPSIGRTWLWETDPPFEESY